MWRVLSACLLCFAVSFICPQMKGESNHYGTSLQILSSGDKVVKLTNHYTQPIEAYHYSYHCSNGVSIERVYDSHKNFPVEKALASGEASQFTLGAELVDCAGGVDVVVYADGSYEGDPTGLKTIIEGRQGVSSECAYWISTIKDNAPTYIAADQVLNDVKKRQHSIQNGSNPQSFMLGQNQADTFVLANVRLLTEESNLKLSPADLLARKMHMISVILQRWKKDIDNSTSQQRLLGMELAQ